MKKALLYLMGAALVLWSCGKEDPVPEPDPVTPAPKDITLSANTFSFPAEGGTASLDVTAPFKPTLRGVPAWLQVQEGEFEDYQISYTLTAEKNDTDTGVTVSITITSGMYSQLITVSREPGAEVVGPGPVAVDVTDEDLTNPAASAQARNVYAFLRQKAGKQMLSGVQSGGTANNNERANTLFQQTGKHPALVGYDYIFLQYSPTPASWDWKVDYGDISAAREQWQHNGLVSFMWHWNVPASEEAWKKGVEKGDFSGYNFYCDKTSFSIQRALTEGTWEHEFILQDIAKVAGYLKLLQAEGIPVLWRPLHEAAGNYTLYGDNGAWFWWGRGGADPCKRLWKLLRDKLEGEYGLDNLIWVWTLDATEGTEKSYSDWYPGNDLVDIVGVDIYAEDTKAKERQYQAAVALSAGHKLVTVSECGNIPDPSLCLGAGQTWNWFLVWDLDSYSLNTVDYWKTLMASPRVLTREAMPSLK